LEKIKVIWCKSKLLKEKKLEEGDPEKAQKACLYYCRDPAYRTIAT
jgi:hypothetical protein